QAGLESATRSRCFRSSRSRSSSVRPSRIPCVDSGRAPFPPEDRCHKAAARVVRSGRRILKSGEGLLPPDDEHHVEDARADRAPGDGRPERSCKLAQTHPVVCCYAGGDPLQRIPVPASILQLRRQFFQYTTGYRIKRARRRLIGQEWPFSEHEMRFFKQFGKGLGAVLEAI